MNLRKLALLPIAAALTAFGTPAMADTSSLLWQGVTFETVSIDADTLQLTISGAPDASGNWSDITSLRAFEIKDIGDVATATIISGPGAWTTSVDNGLSANFGCATGGTPGACFVANSEVALTDSMTWTIDFTGTNLNFSAPHLKVQFWDGVDTNATGDLLSQTIGVIPEPEVYAMMMAGLGLMAFMARRRRQSLGNLVPA